MTKVGEVEALRENPSVIAELTVPQVVAHPRRRDQRAGAAAEAHPLVA
jgi:hypothetical protein